MGNFRTLDVWQRAISHARNVYRVTESFPRSERFGLASQLRRAAVSVHSNIAEGSRRQGDKEFIYFLRVARGSTGEIESQLEMAAALGMIDPPNLKLLVREAQEVSSMLTGLITYLRHRETKARQSSTW